MSILGKQSAKKAKDKHGTGYSEEMRRRAKLRKRKLSTVKSNKVANGLH